MLSNASRHEIHLYHTHPHVQTMSTAPVCSICHECNHATHVLDPLVYPCGCVNRPVHIMCLQQWQRVRPVRKGKSCCEVCLQPYWGNKYVCCAVAIGVWLVQAGRLAVSEEMGQ